MPGDNAKSEQKDCPRACSVAVPGEPLGRPLVLVNVFLVNGDLHAVAVILDDGDEHDALRGGLGGLLILDLRLLFLRGEPLALARLGVGFHRGPVHGDLPGLVALDEAVASVEAGGGFPGLAYVELPVGVRGSFGDVIVREAEGAGKEEGGEEGGCLDTGGSPRRPARPPA